MGGDRVSTPSFISEEEFIEDKDFSQLSLSFNPSYHSRDDLSGKVEDGKVNEESEVVDQGITSRSLEFTACAMRRYRAKMEVLRSYNQSQARIEGLKEAKGKILSYNPGVWIEKAGGMKLSDYEVPTTTTLLLVGPKGSGKSSLVNKISRVFEDDEFASERAQVFYNQSVGDGTYFLQEYMIPRGSTSFCLYDTHGLSNDSSDNIEMIKHWITKGVRHGELIMRPFDSPALRARIKCKVRENRHLFKQTRMVNFVLFVVDGLTVLKSIVSGGDEGTQYMDTITTAFNSPYLSFKDDKPVVVITHGDLMSLEDCARVRVHLGEQLGISPVTQIFDIPERNDLLTELNTVDMLRYCLEHADKNLPRKDWLAEKVRSIRISRSVYLFIILAFVFASIYIQHAHTHHPHKGIQHAHTHRPHKSKAGVDWHAIRHLWLDEN